MKSCLLLAFFALSISANDKVVSNGMTPQGKAWQLEMTEELRFGPDEDEEAYFWSGASVTLQISNKGHFLIIDPGEFRILEFDDKGKFVKQIGRQGEGPGEFQQLTSFSLLDDGSMVVFQNVQGLTYLDFFDKDYNFIRRQTNKPIKLFLQSVQYAPDGKTMSGMFIEPDKNDQRSVTVSTGILSHEQEILHKATTQKQESFNPTRSSDPNYWAEFLAQWFSLGKNGHGLFAFDSNNTFVAVSKEYAIDVFEPSMKNRRYRITREYKPVFQNEETIDALVEPIGEQLLSSLPPDFAKIINDNVIRKAIEKSEFPNASPPIFGLIALDGKGLLVIHKYNPITEKAEADIFDAQGTYRGTTALPPIQVNLFATLTGGSNKMIVKGDKIYAIEKDESGEFYATRYKWSFKK